MLRITTHNRAEHLTFQLEGRLAGPWVLEMVNCWSSVLSGRRLPEIRVDLTSVTYIDAAGKELLRDLHANGAELVAADCLMNAVVAEIKLGQPPVEDVIILRTPTEHPRGMSRRRKPVVVSV